MAVQINQLFFTTLPLLCTIMNRSVPRLSPLFTVFPLPCTTHKVKKKWGRPGNKVIPFCIDIIYVASTSRHKLYYTSSQLGLISMFSHNSQ